MAESRPWGPAGATKGVCITCGGPARSERAFYCEEHKPDSHHRRETSRETSGEQLTIDAESQVSVATPETSYRDSSTGPEPSTQSSEEAAPQVSESEEAIPRKPGMLARIRARRGRTTRDGAPGPIPGERAPRAKRPNRRRLPLDADISDVWGFVGRRLEPTAHYPTGRMLTYQGPAAGVIIDRAIAGTLPDRVVFQPLARNRDKYEDVGFLLAGPLLTFSITTTMQQMHVAQEDGDPEAFNDLAQRLQMQQEMFGWVLSMMLPRLAVGAKQAAEKKAKRDKVIADAFPELGPDDPVQRLVEMLFTPPQFQEASQNGRPPDGTTADVGEPHHVAFGD